MTMKASLAPVGYSASASSESVGLSVSSFLVMELESRAGVSPVFSSMDGSPATVEALEAGSSCPGTSSDEGARAIAGPVAGFLDVGGWLELLRWLLFGSDVFQIRRAQRCPYILIIISLSPLARVSHTVCAMAPYEKSP